MSSGDAIKRVARFVFDERAALDNFQPAEHPPIGSLRPPRQVGLLLSAVCVLAMVSAFAWLPAHAKAQFEIIDSKVWASGVRRIPPTWIDSRQVLFLTGSGFKMNELIWSLAIWDIQGKARIYRLNVHEYCYRDGLIVYKQIDTTDRRRIRGTWFAGKLGEEKPVRNDTEGDVARIHDPINCTIATVEELVNASKQTNRKTVALLEGHGHLDFGPELGPDSLKNSPVRFFRTGSSQANQLPFGRLQVSPPMEYYPFSKAYVFSNWFYGKQASADSPRLPTRDSRVAWVLDADGAITEHSIQEGPWTGGPGLVPYLTMRGLVFVNHGSTKRADGVYLSIDGKPQKLIGGRVSRIGVSSDGCMFAFSHSPSMDQDRANTRNLRTLKAINLCRR